MICKCKKQAKEKDLIHHVVYFCPKCKFFEAVPTGICCEKPKFKEVFADGKYYVQCTCGMRYPLEKGTSKTPLDKIRWYNRKLMMQDEIEAIRRKYVV